MKRLALIACLAALATPAAAQIPAGFFDPMNTRHNAPTSQDMWSGGASAGLKPLEPLSPLPPLGASHCGLAQVQGHDGNYRWQMACW